MRKFHFIYLLIFVLFGCERSSQRVVTDFTEGWRFTLGDDVAYSAPSFDDSAWRLLNLPHDWSIEGEFSEKNPATAGGAALPGGLGWYRKNFITDIHPDARLFVEFDGIYMDSRIFLNGKEIVRHPNGYTSFSVELTPFLNPEGNSNILAVRVDNSLQPNSRWYSGSGIYRNVRLVETADLFIPYSGTYVTTPEVTKTKASVSMETTIRNASAETQKVVVGQAIFDARGHAVNESIEIVEIPAETTEVVRHLLSINNPVRWDVENPHLYKVITTISRGSVVLDRYTTRFGVRTFRFDAESGFYLNDKPMKILGVCNHHDLGALGTAVNYRATQRQLELMKSIGVNAIRTSHNPPSPELLELCDEMGFLVMDELFDMWRRKKSAYDYARFFDEYHEQDLHDFIVRDRNHPSIILWSFGNEILEQWDSNDGDMDLQQANLAINFGNELSEDNAETNVGVLLTRKLARMVRELDPTRPVTTGNNEPNPKSNLNRAGAVDVLGFNYHYQNYDEVPVNFPGLPFIASETTSGLMTRGWYEKDSQAELVQPARWDIPFASGHYYCSAYDQTHAPWSSTHEVGLREVMRRDYVSGMFIWTGIDYLGEPTPYWWPARSSYFGIFDLAGFRKDIAYMYEAEWTDNIVLHIFPHWNHKSGDVVDVWAYYNKADEVELFLNGVSLGSKSKLEESYHVWWRVPYEPGTLLAISRLNGAEVARCEVSTTGTPSAIRMTPDRATIHNDGKDLSFITVEVVDSEGRMVPTAENQIHFTVEGAGTFEAVDNGSQFSHESFKKPERKAFFGKALLVVRGAKEKGEIVITAEAEGLDSAVLSVKVE